MRSFLIIFLFSAVFLSVKAQTVDSVQHNQGAVKVKTILSKDSLAQDTTKREETKKERKAREKAEKERSKYYYKDILKDSTRLAIEELSRVAWRRSLFVPGWGQITNGGLWWIKVPVIYGGLVSAYLIFDYWNWYYHKFGDEASFRINSNGTKRDPDFFGVDNNDFLIRQKDYGRRNRDLTILATIGFWGLNVVEAYTTSILKYRYNMGDQLSFKFSPSILPNATPLAFASGAGAPFTPGIKLTMYIK